ncbi:hypothetical protein Pcinc_008555 [Petrolisthes cinctipes]|uniref:Uncharacterized protein n=1 Tax=Petrolisthes cinctipes TaxID=88211 RepID=A0AAE1G8J3_PETCI|nr:hypothetical protein Pcinc_008555 [Petrolisthes cinctipes]
MALDYCSATTSTSCLNQSVTFGRPACAGNAGKRGSGAGDGKGLSFSFIHGPQKGSGKNEIGDGPEQAKQIRENITFQDGFGCSGPHSSEEGRLVSIPGSQGCLLARPDPPQVSPLSGLPGGDRDVPVYQAPFRSFSSSASLHKTREGGGIPSGRGGCPHPHVPGRLVASRPFQGAGSKQRPGSEGSARGNGVSVEHPQVLSHPHSQAVLARNRVGLSFGHPLSRSRQRPPDPPPRPPGAFFPYFLSPPVGIIARVPKFRGPCNAPGTTETQEADAGGKPPPVPRTQGPSQASVPLSPPPPSPLATSRCPASAGPLGVPSPGDYGGDRRIGRRLGIPVLPGTSTVRGMEGRGKATAHQRPGVDGSEGMAQQTPSVCQDRRPLRYGQRCGRAVPTETGHRTVGNSPVPVRTDFRNSGQEGHSPLGPLRARAGERLGGRPIQVQGDVSRVATASPCVRVSLPSLRDTGGGPIRLPIHGPTPSVPDFLIQNRGGRPGRLHGGLEQVGSSLPLPTPSHFSPPEGDPQAAHFQGEGSPHSPPLASTAVVRRVVPVVPASPSVGIGVPLQHPVCTTPSVTETTRLEFLRGVLSKRFTKETVDKMLRAHRQSSVRQYESCWKRFQDFLRRHPSRVISEDTVLEFLTWLADSTNRAPATVLAHHAALSDPLLLGFNIKVSERPLSLLRMGIRAGTAPHRAQAPSWSLHRVLSYLTFEGVPLEVCHLLQKALFLLALATGYRASQLAALTRHTAFSSVTPNLTSLTISPSPAFLAKNEQADDRIGPLAVPSFLRDGNFHPLCPVHAFVAYVEATRGASPDHLFYNSRSGNPLFPRSIARLLCRVIENGDPGHAPRAHSVRGVAASLAFLRTHSVERVRDLGGWASTSSFRTRYLFHSLSPTPCVAMGTPPPIPQGPRGRHMGGRGRPKRKGRVI